MAEYRYNGLGFMIGIHEDTDTDGDADASDKWYYPAYDEAWRMVANFRESDSSPKEEWVNHLAGNDGYGGSSYYNGIVLRDKDANTAWTSASDGTLEQRVYLCQNWRGDVSALVKTGKLMLEWDKYSAYGMPFGLPGADTDSDGDCDGSGAGTDIAAIQTLIDGSAYGVRADVDLDGDVDATDKTTAQDQLQGRALGWLSLSGTGNRTTCAGRVVVLANCLANGQMLSVFTGTRLTRSLIASATNRHYLPIVSWSPVDPPSPQSQLLTKQEEYEDEGFPSSKCKGCLHGWSQKPRQGTPTGPTLIVNPNMSSGTCKWDRTQGLCLGTSCFAEFTASAKGQCPGTSRPYLGEDPLPTWGAGSLTIYPTNAPLGILGCDDKEETSTFRLECRDANNTVTATDEVTNTVSCSSCLGRDPVYGPPPPSIN